MSQAGGRTARGIPGCRAGARRRRQLSRILRLALIDHFGIRLGVRGTQREDLRRRPCSVRVAEHLARALRACPHDGPSPTALAKVDRPTIAVPAARSAQTRGEAFGAGVRHRQQLVLHSHPDEDAGVPVHHVCDVVCLVVDRQDQRDGVEPRHAYGGARALGTPRPDDAALAGRATPFSQSTVPVTPRGISRTPHRTRRVSSAVVGDHLGHERAKAADAVVRLHVSSERTSERSSARSVSRATD